MAAPDFNKRFLTGAFIDAKLERAFQRHNWRDTWATQLVAAACLHVITLGVWWGGWRSGGAAIFVATNYAVFFYGALYLRAILHGADARVAHFHLTPLQRLCVNYVESGTVILHWGIILVFHVWHNAAERHRCRSGVTTACLFDSGLSFEQCISATPLLHAWLSSMIVSLLDGRFWVAGGTIVALNLPWILEFWQSMESSWRSGGNNDFVRIAILLACMVIIVSVHTWSNLGARRKYQAPSCVAAPTNGWNCLHVSLLAGKHFQDMVLLERKSGKLEHTLAAERDAVQLRTKAERAVVLSDGLRQAQRLLVDFVSHKLRQPLHLLQNTVDALCGLHVGEDFDALSRATTEVSRLARELVLHHELSAGVQETTVQSVNLPDWLHDVKTCFQSKTHLTGDAVIDAYVPEVVPMDPLWARESLFCLLRLLDSADKAAGSVVTLHATTILAPMVTNDDLVRHRNIFTSALWLDRCEEMTGDFGSAAPEALTEAGLSAQKRAEANFHEEAGHLGWFLQIEARATGFATGAVLRELARPMPDDVQPATRRLGSFLGTTSPVELQVQTRERQHSAAPIYATSTRMDLRLAKLAAGVLRGRIGILVESDSMDDHADANMLTRLVLQLPMPWEPPSPSITQGVIDFPCPFDLFRPEQDGPPPIKPFENSPRTVKAHSGVQTPSPERALRRRKAVFSTPIASDASGTPSRVVQSPIATGVQLRRGVSASNILRSISGGSAADKQSSPAEHTLAAAEHVVALPPVVPSLRILVVDDEASIRKLHCRLLQKLNLTCDTVDDGDQVQAAIDAAALQGRPYDAVLMDLVMKRVHGDHACAGLRQRGYKGAILAATANANPSDHDRLVRMGFTSVLCKPFSLPQLKSALEGCGLTVEPTEADTNVKHHPTVPSNT
jgi:CheY-like chemotaxis protein